MEVHALLYRVTRSSLRSALNITNRDVPIKFDTPGVSLMSGFSGELLKLFLENKEISPMLIMLNAIKNYKVTIEESER